MRRTIHNNTQRDTTQQDKTRTVVVLDSPCKQPPSRKQSRESQLCTTAMWDGRVTVSCQHNTTTKNIRLPKCHEHHGVLSTSHSWIVLFGTDPSLQRHLQSHAFETARRSALETVHVAQVIHESIEPDLQHNTSYDELSKSTYLR